MQYDAALVLDNGSGLLKAGFTTDDGERPRIIYQNVVGRPRPLGASTSNRERFVGSSVQEKRHLLSLSYPVKRGVVVDWDSLEYLWQSIFKEMQVDVTNGTVLVTEALHTPRTNREKISEYLFERFNTAAMYVSRTVVLGMYAAGLLSGLHVEVGHGVTQALPIMNGYGIVHRSFRFDVAGQDITEYLAAQLYTSRRYSLCTTAELDYVHGLKEKHSRCDPTTKATPIQYQLPDGRIITVGDEVHRCAEMFFAPDLVGVEKLGLHHVLVDTLAQCDINIRQCLAQHILVSGGTSCMPLFKERLQTKMMELNPGRSIKMVDFPNSQYAAWLGGLIFASLSTFGFWICKEEYDESGPAIVHRKCF